MHKLPDLPYEYKALEPHIDARTMEIHHTKHHAGYVDKLNQALEGIEEYLTMEVEELLGKLDTLPEEIRTAVRNAGGGHANHKLFWQIMAPGGKELQDSKLREAIDSTFGDMESFKEKFSDKAAGVFGSGWA